ncbi:MAG: Cys-tRNA(Pro) deacylase [Ruminococcus sp.]|nr:Cys-tRNA(Pro) deacylase [Ruminococcus sp.]
MAKENPTKTNAMRILDRAKVSYIHRSWEEATAEHTGVELAAALGQNPAQVFKTLVTQAKSGSHYVFLIPVAETLDLKKAAAAVHEKALTMLKAKDLLPLTGYVHGGCSPVGMKKLFVTTIHKSAEDFEKILFSAGKIGHQLEVSLTELKDVVPYTFADVVV